jgi:NADPH:quinone reductase
MTTIPKTMRAVAIDRFGAPDVLKVGMLPVPSPDADEVIPVHTAGVGGWVADIRAGRWTDSVDPHFSLVLGTDGSGNVAGCTWETRSIRTAGTIRKMGFTRSTSRFRPKESHRYLRCSMFGLPGLFRRPLTALQVIDGALHVRSGQSVLIHGASGGVGTLAVQFAKLRGARVLASASGPDGIALVRRLGADEAIDGRHEDLPAAVRRSAPHGLDTLLALAGGDALQDCIATVRDGGRVAFPNGVETGAKTVRRGHAEWLRCDQRRE